MINVYLLLGSNLGHRMLFLKQAVTALNALGSIAQCSSIYETESWGKKDIPDYLNQVVHLKTDLSANALLNETQSIELAHGRERHEKWGSRTLDIDLLFYGDQIINESNLKIPHPELHNRRFTLEPLAEIAPQLTHPVLGKNILMLKAELTDDLNVKIY